MSLSEQQMIELMQFADGELDTEGATRVKKLLAGSGADADEARMFVKELGVLAELVTEAEPLTVLAAETFDIADAVMDKIDATQAVEPPKVVRLDAAREKRRRVGVFVATGLALAAGIALVVRNPGDSGKTARVDEKLAPQVSAPIAHAPDLPASSSEASQQVAHAGANGTDRTGESGVEVNVSDSPQSGFSVFYLPASGASSASAVVWIDESSGGNH